MPDKVEIDPVVLEKIIFFKISSDTMFCMALSLLSALQKGQGLPFEQT